MKKENNIGMVSAFLVILLASTLLDGCGNAKKEAPASQTAGVSTTGFTSCYRCHADTNNPAALSPDPTIPSAPFGNTAQIGWVDGTHANPDTLPSYAMFSGSTCATCHDQLGDGRRIENFYFDTGIDLVGTTNKPIVACESCHGGGGNHFGLGPLPYPKSDPTKCGACHSRDFPHLEEHPEGRGIGEAYAASPHSRSINSRSFVAGSTTDVRARCSRCHTDEGAKRYLPVAAATNTYNEIVANMTGKPDVATASNVQCRTCHVNAGHGPGKLLGENATGLPVAWSAEFKTCTSCHQLLKADSTLLDQSYHTPYDATGTEVNQFGSMEEIIPDTHYDNPETPTLAGGGDWVAGTGGIEGYIIDPTAAHSSSAGNTNRGICRDCHNPHDADTAIHKQWARSAHGGHILDKKEGATNAYMAAVLPADAPGWIYYNWKRPGRAACQRCHTSTGFRNFANSPTTYSPTANVFVATGSQAEMLYCWACHTDNVGGLRNPGALTFTYTNGATATYPDVKGSNICIACHTGRETGDSIKNDPDADGIRSFINSHYLTGGGTVFTTTGYEYAGRNYNNVSFYAHDKIGTAARPGTGINGPCAGCHMSSAQSHIFLPLTKDGATGNITAITSTVCAVCHTGSFALSPEGLMEEEHEYAAALEVLKATLAAKGMFFAERFPYFFIDSNGNGVLESTETTAFTSWAGVYGFAGWKDTMGAAFNLNLLLHDPGGYAHNRFYVKGLIWDSIDFIDDGILNHSVPATITARTATPDNFDTTVDAATADAARRYLGSTRPGDANRP